MSQPWEFLGYQKVSTATYMVTFSNLLTNSSTGAMRYKIVVESLSTSASNGTYAGATGFYPNQSSNSWRSFLTYGQSTSLGNGNTSLWSQGMTGQSVTGIGPSNGNAGSGWTMMQGVNGLNEPRRYSGAEDDLQWGIATCEFNQNHANNSMPGGFLQSVNVQSRTGSTCIASYQWGSWSGSSSTQSSTTMNIYNNENFLAGSKFWMWAQRVNNNFV
tara:strand:+ start:2481 stop:3128 length:648 start_codon:yes stop_codon:yes gene_type:complete